MRQGREARRVARALAVAVLATALAAGALLTIGAGTATAGPPPPPPNDDFAHATVWTPALGSPIVTSGVGATQEPGEPGYVGNSVWWRFTSPVDTYVDLDSSGSAASIAVFTGSTVSNLTAVAIGESWQLGHGGEYLSFEASAGVQYSIAAGAYGFGSTSDGRIVLHIAASDGAVLPGVLSVAESSRTLAVPVGLSAPLNHSVTVSWSTRDWTATAPADYAAASGVVTFAPGETSKSVELAIKADGLDEADEVFAVAFTNPVGATLGGFYGFALVTLLDVDEPPWMGIPPDPFTGHNVIEGNSGTKTAQIPVELDRPSGRTVTVDWHTADSDATAPGDYTASSGTLTFASGETAKTISVPVRGDTILEGAERFEVDLTNATNADVQVRYDDLPSGLAFVTIVDDDAVPVVNPGAVTVAEGNSGTTVAQVPVSLSSPSGKTVTVDWSTANSSATAPADYTAGSGTVTFAPGETEKTVAVTIKGDTKDEPDELALVAFGNPTNATVGGFYGLGFIGISDDDAPPAIIPAWAGVAEGDLGSRVVQLNVSLSSPSGKTVTASWATADSTATAPADYSAASGTVTFAPGETVKSVPLTVKGDLLHESPDEYFNVVFSNPVNATLGGYYGVGLLTLLDND